MTISIALQGPPEGYCREMGRASGAAGLYREHCLTTIGTALDYRHLREPLTLHVATAEGIDPACVLDAVLRYLPLSRIETITVNVGPRPASGARLVLEEGGAADGADLD